MTASVLEKAIEKWGKEAQTIVAMEECAELIKECSKMLRGQGNIDHLIEEIADVKMCLEQLEDYIGSDRVNEVFAKKMQKLLDEIEEMKKIKKDNK